MSAKNKTDKTAVYNAVHTSTEALYTKEQILSSKKYSHRKDALNVVLKDDTQYTVKQVDGLIENLMKTKEKGKVK